MKNRILKLGVYTIVGLLMALWLLMPNAMADMKCTYTIDGQNDIDYETYCVENKMYDNVQYDLKISTTSADGVYTTTMEYEDYSVSLEEEYIENYISDYCYISKVDCKQR